MDKVESVTFRYCEQLLTKQDILDFEEILNIKLPDEFITHYSTFNGGFPNANWSEGLEYTCPLRHFFSIKYGEDTIEKRMQELQMKPS